MIKELQFKCWELEIDATTTNDQFRIPISRVKAFKVEMEDIMENLNFEDVMNYYGVVRILEWAEGNK